MIRFGRTARNVQWGGGFGDLGHIPHLPKTGGWRTTPPAVVDTGVCGRSPSAQKKFFFWQN